MKADIDITVSYPHPPGRVWAALTSSEALAAWLMPNDFEPVVGRRFTFRTRPAPGFDGIVRCEVLELDPPRRMVWSWAGGNIDTTVIFTLEATAGGDTRLSSGRRPSVVEVTHAGEVERDPGRLGRGDDQLVADRPARLGDRAHAGVGEHLKAVGEREVRVAGRD